jgi:hypothetical protein
MLLNYILLFSGSIALLLAKVNIKGLKKGFNLSKNMFKFEDFLVYFKKSIKYS